MLQTAPLAWLLSNILFFDAERLESIGVDALDDGFMLRFEGSDR